MDWHRLDRDKTVNMINSVKGAADALLFPPTTSEAKCARLPFYTNHLLYRLTNFSSMPTFTMDFIGDGEQYRYLDGSEFPIKEINAANGLSLNKDNVIPYLNFYFFNVRTEDGDVMILKNASEGQSIDLYDEERRENLNVEPDDVRIEFDENLRVYNVFAPIYYLGSLVDAKLIVMLDGTVIIHPLKLLTGGV